MSDKEKIRIKSDALDVDLMLHFRFTAEALEANQDGRLSQEQTSHLIRQALNSLVFAVGVVGFVTPTCTVGTLGTADNRLTGITLILGLSTAVFSVIRFGITNRICGITGRKPSRDECGWPPIGGVTG
ncbi:MAG TPA: hypothetical protein VHO69_15865 [Phototrophicaceae bacterium]|nr:hypothetical protein [Phototrophicaceae bacterium]